MFIYHVYVGSILAVVMVIKVMGIIMVLVVTSVDDDVM